MTRVTKIPLTGPTRPLATSAAARSAGENSPPSAPSSARFRLFAAN